MFLQAQRRWGRLGSACPHRLQDVRLGAGIVQRLHSSDVLQAMPGDNKSLFIKSLLRMPAESKEVCVVLPLLPFMPSTGNGAASADKLPFSAHSPKSTLKSRGMLDAGARLEGSQ